MPFVETRISSTVSLDIAKAPPLPLIWAALAFTIDELRLLLSAVSGQLLATKQQAEGGARLDETARALRDQVEHVGLVEVGGPQSRHSGRGIIGNR